MRPSLRNPDELRAITITPGYLKHGEGSVLVTYGDTKVICTASLIQGVPRFLKGQNQGWLTAEYGMLPRSTNDRMDREAVKGKQGGRTLEIQRLIGRSLRNALNLTGMGEITLTLDCDVIQADGGTRTASITGGCVALHLALLEFKKRRPQLAFPFKQWISAVSVGMYKNIPILDLDYQEDSNAETDMNVVMTESGRFIEVQGTAEGQPFTQAELNSMLNLAQQGNQILIAKQKEAIAQFLR